MRVTTQDAAEAYPAIVELSRRKHRNLSASQLVWAKLERTAARVALVRRLSDPSDASASSILEQCDQRLRLAHDRIDRPFRQTWAFWELVHRVDEELLLVTPVEMLAAEATDVLAKFDRKITDTAVREAWLGPDKISGPLPRAIQRLRQGTPIATRPLQLVAGDRDLLRGALNLVNVQGDTNFWRLGSNVSVQSFSAVLLLLLLVVAVLRPVVIGSVTDPRPDLAETLMLGAAGAILANLIATRPFIISLGPTIRYYVHSLFVKPVIGAFAAGLVYLLESAGLVFIAISQAGSRGDALAGNAQAFVRSMVAVAAGFAGEWMLRPMMDKVLRAISVQSEKVTTSVPSRPR